LRVESGSETGPTLVPRINQTWCAIGAGGGIRTHEGLRHRVLSPGQAPLSAYCPFDLAMVPPRLDGAPGGTLRGAVAAFEPAINGYGGCDSPPLSG